VRRKVLVLTVLLMVAPLGGLAAEGDDVGKEFGYCAVKEGRDGGRAVFSTVFHADFVDFYGGYMSDKMPEIQRHFRKYAYAYWGVDGDATCYRRPDRRKAEEALMDEISQLRREGGWDVEISHWHFRG